MFLFKRYELKQEDEKVEVILHLVQQKEEFGEDFFIKAGEKLENLRDSAGIYIKEKIPNVKSATVKVVAGGFLISSFSFYTKPVQAADFNMSYVFIGNTDTYISEVDQTQGNVDVISPDYFEINSDGTLKVTSKYDSRLISEMHNRNVRVVPYLSNNWDRELGRTALSNREVLSSQLANFILSNNLDGLNIDIENVTDVDRANYTDFVRLLRQKLGSDKEISVAVAANPSNWQTGWHGSYDYNALSQYADYLMIMAYDEHYYGGVAGPVASIGWVEKSIQYALNQQVPKEKIVLGIPFFGRYWKDGATVGGTGVTNKTVESIIEKYNGVVIFDTVAQSPKTTITIKVGDPTTTINGVVLQPGTYTFWYENDASIEAKIDLVHKYGLKGTGNWALGGENNSIWTSYYAWLSGETVPVDSPPVVTPEPTPDPVVTPEPTPDPVVTPEPTPTPDPVVTPTPTPTPAPTPTPTPIAPKEPKLKAPARPLKKGSAGIDVRTLQTALKQKGYLTGTIDGILGTKTRAAVIAFQRANGLRADGVAGNLTYSRLFTGTVSTGIASVTKTPVAPVKSYTTLNAGSRGIVVINIQSKLKALGFLTGKVDGIYGVATKNAVKNFQRKYGLRVDGIAGSKTIAKIYSI